MRRTVFALSASGIIAAAFLLSGFSTPQAPTKVPVEYFSGHLHDLDETHGAPQHSGGLDRNGCHNGSIPYHCH